jgi:hypothetical protein
LSGAATVLVRREDELSAEPGVVRRTGIPLTRVEADALAIDFDLQTGNRARWEAGCWVGSSSLGQRL